MCYQHEKMFSTTKTGILNKIAVIGFILAVTVSMVMAAPTPLVTASLRVGDLPYAYDALEPIIDEATMRVHRLGHHQAYASNLNSALITLQDSTDTQIKNLLRSFRVETLLANLHLLNIDNAIKTQIRNNGGGYVNHNIFFDLIKPSLFKGAEAEPSQAVIGALESTFGTFMSFKRSFSEAALKVFGSGWVMMNRRRKVSVGTGLPVDEKFELVIKTYANQDNCFSATTASDDSKTLIVEEPVIALDVWEHAYYLKHQNKRGVYVDAFWQALNWDVVETRLFKKTLDVEFIGSTKLTKAHRENETVHTPVERKKPVEDKPEVQPQQAEPVTPGELPPINLSAAPSKASEPETTTTTKDEL